MSLYAIEFPTSEGFDTEYQYLRDHDGGITPDLDQAMRFASAESADKFLITARKLVILPAGVDPGRVLTILTEEGSSEEIVDTLKNVYMLIEEAREYQRSHVVKEACSPERWLLYLDFIMSEAKRAQAPNVVRDPKVLMMYIKLLATLSVMAMEEHPMPSGG